MTVTILRLSWSVSRGAETYGYNIRRLDDTDTGKRYRCMGGGYDMTGTVLADWFTDRHADRIMAAVDSGELVPHSTWSEAGRLANDNGAYGLQVILREGEPFRPSIDGACGESSVIRIMRAVGFDVRAVYGGRRSQQGVLEYVITDTDA